MDVKCPFCSEVVEIPEGSSESSEIECPSCRAAFDVTAAKLFSGESDVKVESVPVERTGEKKETEAWLRDSDDPDEPVTVTGTPEVGAEPGADAPDPDSGESPETEAWLRDEAPPKKKFKMSGLGGYGFSGKDLAHADEVFLPKDAMASRKKEDQPPPESGSGVDDLDLSAEPVGGEDEPPPIPDTVLPPPLQPSEPAEPPQAPEGGGSRSSMVDNIFEPPGKSDQGDIPSFDDLLPGGEEQSKATLPPPANDSIGAVEEGLDPTLSWMGAGPGKAESEVLLPPSEEPDAAESSLVDDLAGSGKGPVSVNDFNIPDRLDLVQQSGFDSELPEPKGPSGYEPEATHEWDGLKPETPPSSDDSFNLEIPADVPAGEPTEGSTGGLDLSFDDLDIPGEQGPAGESQDTAAIGSLDIDAALSEESEPEAELGLKIDHGEPSGQIDVGGVDSIFESGAGSASVSAEDSGGDLGLPDAWPENFDAGDDGAIPPIPDVDIPTGSMEIDNGGLGEDAPPMTLDLDLDRSLSAESNIEAAAPPVPTQKAPAAASQRKVRVGASGVKVALMGVLLVVLVGLILGQTEYGYFGFNLFVPDDMDMLAGKKALPAPGQTTGIVRDTKESYMEEIARLESLVREDPEDVKSRADLLEILMRFRERYPQVVASKPKMVSRIEFLEKQTAVKGQKAGMVKVMDLVNGGNYQEAKAVLDGMVVATAQDADVLYFYGKIALGQKKLDEAQKYFELALMKNPALLVAKYFLARVQIEKKNPDRAKAILKEVLKVEPGHIATKVALSQLALAGGEKDKAAKLAGEVISKAASDAYAQELFDAHIVLARIQETSGTAEGRLQELKAALAIKPAEEDTAMLVSTLLTEEGETEQALGVLEPCRMGGCESEEFLGMYARAAFKAEKDEKASEALKAGASKYPDSATFSIIRGGYLLRLGRPRAASSAFEEAVAIDPASIEGHVLLAKALSREGKLNEAVKRLNEGLNHVERKVPLLEGLAEVFREKRDFPQAENALRKIVSIDGTNNPAKQELGIVILKLDRAAESAKILESLHKKRALTREGSLALAESYLRLSKPQKAKDVLSQLYGKKDDDPDVAAEYGRALTASKKYKEAKKVLKAVVASRPSHAPGHFYLGKLYAKTKHMKMATDELMRAVQLKSTDTDYRLELARVMLRRDSTEHTRDAKLQLDQVVNAYRRGEVLLEQQNPDAYMLRGRLLFKEEKYGMAMHDFEAALSLSPSRVDLLMGYGTTLYEMARYKEATPYFEQVLKRDRSHTAANYYLGRIMLRRGEIDRARDHLEIVSRKDPKEYPESLRFLGLIYRDQKLNPLARRTFAAYLKLAPKNSSEAIEIRRLLDRM